MMVVPLPPLWCAVLIPIYVKCFHWFFLNLPFRSTTVDMY